MSYIPSNIEAEWALKAQGFEPYERTEREWRDLREAYLLGYLDGKESV